MKNVNPWNDNTRLITEEEHLNKYRIQERHDARSMVLKKALSVQDAKDLFAKLGLDEDTPPEFYPPNFVEPKFGSSV